MGTTGDEVGRGDDVDPEQIRIEGTHDWAAG
jgi:hypothetical protein